MCISFSVVFYISQLTLPYQIPSWITFCECRHRTLAWCKVFDKAHPIFRFGMIQSSISLRWHFLEGGGFKFAEKVRRNFDLVLPSLGLHSLKILLGVSFVIMESGIQWGTIYKPQLLWTLHSLLRGKWMTYLLYVRDVPCLSAEGYVKKKKYKSSVKLRFCTHIFFIIIFFTFFVLKIFNILRW